MISVTLKYPINFTKVDFTSINALTVYGDTFNFNSLWPLTRAKNLKHLTISGYGGEICTGILDHLTNLETLKVINNSIFDFTGIEKLNNLKTLKIESHNARFNQDELAKLRSVENFSICCSGQSDEHIIKNWENLRSLYINEIRTFEPFRNLKKLKKLSMHEANRVSSLEPLSELSELECISANECGCDSLDPLINCKNLKYIKLDDTRINSIDPLVHLPELRYISLFQSRITLIKSLLNHKNLEFVCMPFSYGIPQSDIDTLIKNNKNLLYLGLNEIDIIGDYLSASDNYMDCG